MAGPAAHLHILVSASTGKANAALAATESQMRGTQKRSAAMSAKIAKAAKLAGLGAAAGAVYAAKAAIDFESAFADVEKTVDANAKGYARLEKGIRNMAKQIPTGANELAHLAGIAGQLGIKRKSILRFTRTVADLGETTNLQGEDAATTLARIANIMGTSQKDYRRLGSVIVELGNNLATTEADITEMSLRLAKTGKQVGLSEAQVLAFSGALSSVGVKAQAGGSGFSKAFIEMATAVKSGGENLNTFADVAGVSTAKFKQQFQNDAALAMVAFTEGLGEINKEGGNVFAVLEDLGLSEIRVRDALLGAAGSGDLFRQALNRGTQEWKRNNALTKEAQKRYRTTAAQLQILKNRVKDWFIQMGQKLLPTIKRVVNILTNNNLSGQEKFSRVFKIISDKAIAAFFKIAERATVMAPRVAAAFVRGFVNAPIWSKIAVGGFLLAKLGGGVGAFGRLGSKSGRRWGLAFIGALLTLELGKQIKQIIEGHELQAPKSEKFRDYLKEFFRINNQQAAQIIAPNRVAIKTELGTLIFNSQTRRVIKAQGDKLARFVGKEPEQIVTKFDQMRKRVVGNVGGMVNQSSRGIGVLGRNLNSALGALNVPKAPFRIEPFHPRGKQRGGPIEQGAASGDSVPAMLERGEYVLNRNAVAKLGKHRLDAINFGAAKRFQTGGLVGLQAGARRLGENLIDRFGGFISSGVRPGDTDSFHGRGMAVDWVGGDWARAARYMNSIGPSLLEGIYTGAHGGPSVSWDSGHRVPPGFWGGSTWAAHSTHIHGAISGRIKAFVRQIKRLMLAGPEGPLRDLGQAALDVVWKAGNRKLSSIDTLGMDFLGGRGGLSKPQIASLWRRVNNGLGDANLMAAIAMAESGGSPTVTNSIGARGLWQIIPSTASAFGLNYSRLTDPAYNALGAGKILRGQGLGAWEAYTNGAYRQFLQLGGLVEMLQGGGSPGVGGAVGVAQAGKKQFPKVERALKQIKGIGISPEPLNTLAVLTGASEQFGEYASNASALTVTDEEGNAILGKFGGKDEATWLQSQLGQLAGLRNVLIDAHGRVLVLQEIVRQRMVAAKERLQRIRKAIRRLNRRRQRLERNIRQAKRAIKQSQARRKHKGKSPAVSAAMLANERRQEARIANWSAALGLTNARKREREADANQITKRIIPALRERGEGLGETGANLLTGGGDVGGRSFVGLKTVQGRGGPMNIMAQLPALGSLGGEIFTVQSRLRQIAEEGKEKAKAAETSGPSEREQLLETLLRESRQRTAVSEAQFGALKGFPAFASGGVFLAGEEGPELVHSPSGARIHSAADTERMLGGEVQVIVKGDIISDAPDPVEVVIGDRRFAGAVKKAALGARGTGRGVVGGARR